MKRLKELRKLHHTDSLLTNGLDLCGVVDVCVYCKTLWPCKVIRIAAATAEAAYQKAKTKQQTDVERLHTELETMTERLRLAERGFWGDPCENHANVYGHLARVPVNADGMHCFGCFLDSVKKTARTQEATT